MSYSRRILALASLALVLSCPFPASSEVIGPPMSVPLVSSYDLAATSYIYCSTADTGGNVWSDGVGVEVPVTTSGASSTVTAVTASTNPFAAVAAGDELVFNLDGVIYHRVVTAKASSDSLTISGFPAATLNLGGGRHGTAGYGFYYRRRTCGTGDTVGWIPVRGANSVSFDIAVVTINATSIDATVYCRGGGSVQTPISVSTKNYTAAGGDFVTLAGGTGGIKFDSCRVGLKVNTDTGVQAVTVAVSR